MTFLQFLKTRPVTYDARGDFIRTALADSGFPTCYSRECIKARLAIARASEEALAAFEKLWREYEKDGMDK